MKRYETTLSSDSRAHTVQKKVCASHNAAAQHDRVWRKKRNQIGHPQPQIIGFPLDALERQRVPLLRQFANLLGGQTLEMGIVLWSLTRQPLDHCWSARQYLPTAARSAKTRRAGRVYNMVSNLGMGLVDASIQPPVDDYAASYPGAYGHANQTAFPLRCSHQPFPQRDRVRVVFHRDRNAKHSRQVRNGVLALPPGKKFDHSDLPSAGINWPGTADTDASDFATCPPGCIPQHPGNAVQRIGVTSIRVSWTFHAR